MAIPAVIGDSHIIMALVAKFIAFVRMAVYARLGKTHIIFLLITGYIDPYVAANDGFPPVF